MPSPDFVVSALLDLETPHYHSLTDNNCWRVLELDQWLYLLQCKISEATDTMEWNPTQFLRKTPPAVPYALIVLNHAINENAYDVLKKHGANTIS